jgi:hypothetical protein
VAAVYFLKLDYEDQNFFAETNEITRCYARSRFRIALPTPLPD